MDSDAEEFRAKSQKLGNNIHKIKQNVKNIQKMTAQIGSGSDCKRFQEHLQKLFQGTNNLAKISREQLKEVISYQNTHSEDSQWQTQCDALQQGLKKALLRLHQAQVAAAEKEEELLKRYSAQEGLSDQNRDGAPGQSLAIAEEQQNIQDLETRAEALRKLEADIVDINQLFKEVAVLVHDQGQKVDDVEKRTGDARDLIEKGLDELKQADKMKGKSRKKQCIIAIICAVVLVIIIIILALSLSN